MKIVFCLWRGLLVGCAACVLPLACSVETPGFDGAPLATEVGAVRPGLTPCLTTSNCAPGLECCGGHCATPAGGSTKLAFTSGSALGYTCYENRDRPSPKNILPDFSHVGFGAWSPTGPVGLPNAQPFGSVIQPDADVADDSPRIQAALDACGSVANFANPRAVVLGPGTFEVHQTLWIRENGVVLRGAGQGATGTVLKSTRPVAHALVRIAPHSPTDISNPDVGEYPLEETDANGVSRRAELTRDIPVGSRWLTVTDNIPFSRGDTVVVVKKPSEQWLRTIGTPWSYRGWREPVSVVNGYAACDSAHPCPSPREVCTDGVCLQPCIRNSECASQMCDCPLRENDEDELCADADDDSDVFPDPGHCALPIPTKHLRIVDSYSSGSLFVDIPMVDSIPRGELGSGYVAKVVPGRFIDTAGIEDVRIDSEFVDDYPQICNNNTPTNLGDDSECGCPNEGVGCVQPNIGCGPGYDCVEGRCRCQCLGQGAACTSTSNCAHGTVCVDGTCKCPGPPGRCPVTNSQCFGGDGGWHGIVMNRAMNSWVRRVTVMKYGYSAVSVGDWSKYNTIEEVAHLDPRSPVDKGAKCPDPNNCSTCDTGNRGLPRSSHRYSFNQGSGVANLYQRLYVEKSRHTFVTGARTTGPHVWLDSVAEKQFADIGPHQRYAVGLLYDNVLVQNPDPYAACVHNGLGLMARNGGTGGSGHGWRGAQVMFWNDDSVVISESPPTARNWVTGGIAVPVSNPAVGEGFWQLQYTTVKPRSLFVAQLTARLGALAAANVVTPQQQNHRIWDDILRWKGEGRLADFTSDPECVAGVRQTNGPACCPAGCATCIASHPNPACRPTDPFVISRSCETTSAPCTRADPTCAWGTKFDSNTACCPAGCTSCGIAAPTGCQPGLRLCGDFPAPCMLRDPSCEEGVEAESRSTSYPEEGPSAVTTRVCCNKHCTQCGGSGCGGQGGCCTGTILADNVSCSGSMSPCVLSVP